MKLTDWNVKVIEMNTKKKAFKLKVFIACSLVVNENIMSFESTGKILFSTGSLIL